MALQLYTPDQQAVGWFDGGKIVEQKPIGFPGEGSAVKRVGPLFYWAWFSAKEFGEIPLHPHKGFEIVTYFLTGVGGHKDSLGTVSTVKGGGAQVMQTGSGAYHAETMDADTAGFQIWFEPFTGEAVKRKPTYAQFEHEEFPTVVQNGATVKSVIGNESPVQLVADAQMWDVQLTAGASFSKDVPAGYSLNGLVVEGDTEWNDGKKAATRVPHRVFAVYGAEGSAVSGVAGSTSSVTEGNAPSALSARSDVAASATQVTVTAVDGKSARVIFILVPSVLPYPDYRHVREFYA